MKGSRMTGRGPHRTPHGIHRAVGVFNRVQGVLNPLRHPVHGDRFLVRHADIDAKQRLRPQILGELKILVIPQPMSGIIIPDIPERRARIDVAHRVLPVVHVGKVIAFHPAAAGKTQKSRLQGIE